MSDTIRFQAGDPRLFADLAARCRPRLLRIIRRYERRRDLQEELLQDTWLHAWQRRAQFSGAGSLDGWLLRVCVSVCRLHVRAARRDAVDWGPVPRDVPDPRPNAATAEAEAVMVQAQHDALLDALVALPPQQRAVSIARWVFGVSTADTARQLRIAPGTVKATLHNVRRTVRATFGGDQTRSFVVPSVEPLIPALDSSPMEHTPPVSLPPRSLPTPPAAPPGTPPRRA